MKKRLLLFATGLTLIALQTKAQVWNYDFGTAEDSISSGVSTSFLPGPESGSASARVRVGTGGGKFVLKNYLGFGSGSSLRIQAPTGGSANKFSIYNISNPTNTLGLKFTFSVGDEFNMSNTSLDNGTFYFSAGTGSSYSDNNAFNGSQTFTGFRITFASGSPNLEVYSGSGWQPSGLSVPYASSISVILYMNNSATSVTYTDINNSNRVMGAGSADLFIYDPLTSTYSFTANFPKGSNFPGSNTLNSFMFYGVNSAGNEANLFLDDIVYSNDIANNTLPVKLSNFNARVEGKEVNLSWKAETETGISSYAVEHSTDGNFFREIGRVPAMEKSAYSFRHSNPSATNLYRLRIMHMDGTEDYSNTVKLRVNTGTAMVRTWFQNGSLYFSGVNAGQLSVFDMSGRQIYNASLENGGSISVSHLPAGTYIAQVKDENGTATVKFVK